LCSPLYPGIHNKAGAVPAQERFGEEPSEEELGSLFLPHIDGGLFKYAFPPHLSLNSWMFTDLLPVRGGYMLVEAGDFIKPLQIVILLNTIPTLILFSAYMIVLLSWAQLYHAAYLNFLFFLQYLSRY
jgi:hypothetical protein